MKNELPATPPARGVAGGHGKITVWMGDGRIPEGGRHVTGKQIYGTREAYPCPCPCGRVVAVPGSWELLFDEPIVARGGRLYWPEFELDPTVTEGEGFRLYAGVTYFDEASRRAPKFEENEFTLPAHLGPVVHCLDVIVNYLQLEPVEDEPAPRPRARRASARTS